MRSVIARSGIAGLLLAVLALSAQAALRVEPEELDFGVVKPGAPTTQSVTITNDGSETIKLLEAQVECQMCTKVTFTPTDLAPRKKLEVPIAFKPPKSEQGPVQRKVT